MIPQTPLACLQAAGLRYEDGYWVSAGDKIPDKDVKIVCKYAEFIMEVLDISAYSAMRFVLFGKF